MCMTELSAMECGRSIAQMALGRMLFPLIVTGVMLGHELQKRAAAGQRARSRNQRETEANLEATVRNNHHSAPYKSRPSRRSRPPVSISSTPHNLPVEAMSTNSLFCCSSHTNYDAYFAAFGRFATTYNGTCPDPLAGNDKSDHPIGDFSHAINFMEYEVVVGKTAEWADDDKVFQPKLDSVRYFFAHTRDDTAAAGEPGPNTLDDFVEMNSRDFAKAKGKIVLAERRYKCVGHRKWVRVLLFEIPQQEEKKLERDMKVFNRRMVDDLRRRKGLPPLDRSGDKGAGHEQGGTADGQVAGEASESRDRQDRAEGGSLEHATDRQGEAEDPDTQDVRQRLEGCEIREDGTHWAENR